MLCEKEKTIEDCQIVKEESCCYRLAGKDPVVRYKCAKQSCEEYCYVSVAVRDTTSLLNFAETNLSVIDGRS